MLLDQETRDSISTICETIPVIFMVPSHGQQETNNANFLGQNNTSMPEDNIKSISKENKKFSKNKNMQHQQKIEECRLMILETIK